MPRDPFRNPPPRPWELLDSRPGPDLAIFSVRFDELRNPRTGASLRRTVLHTPDWVNVVALTADRRLVIVRQYRFGRSEVTVEIPGGCVDPGETPEAAARRELREETGFTAASFVPLGAVEPNPAFHDNLCHHFLASGASRTGEPEFDPGEDIVIETLTGEEVLALVRSGIIRHALVLTALSRVYDLRASAPAGILPAPGDPRP